MDLPTTVLQRLRPQLVFWGRNAGLPAGIRVCDEGDDWYRFVSWNDLKAQLETLLLPQLLADTEGYTVGLLDYYTKTDWLCRVLDPKGNVHCSLWFGPDPDNDWHVDGLVRAGRADDSPAAWMSYQRYSDGSYRRVGGPSTSLDELKRQTEKKHRDGEGDG